MSFARVFSAQPGLIEAYKVSIEVDTSKGGSNNFHIVGLPDKAVEEAQDRVSSAIKHSNLVSPKQDNFKTIVSLAPADLKKNGAIFDLGIAIGFLCATRQLELDLENKIFIGELGLNGEIRKINGSLSVAILAKKLGFKEIFLPKDNANEASAVEEIKIYGVINIKEIIEHFSTAENKKIIEEHIYVPNKNLDRKNFYYSDIKGQIIAKRALLIAATGGHHIGFYGPPGTGKSMLAKALPELLPKLEKGDSLEITSIHSSAGFGIENIIENPPFRSPHHTSSYISLIGGGAKIKPGEITLSHKGVLFLDEFTEFEQRAIESLREPLEERKILISRAQEKFLAPADFQLVIALNPCPCGYYQSNIKQCICSPQIIQKYKKKISGPIIDRIDIWTYVAPPSQEEIFDKKESSLSEVLNLKLEIEKNRKEIAKEIRKINPKYSKIADIQNRDINKICKMTDQAEEILKNSSQKLFLSPRVIHKIIKISKTISYIENKDIINQKHILEALQFRKTPYV
jgi:magnesium chelatase family protein